MLSFGSRLRAARLEKGMSQEQLGAPLFSRSYMSLVESGQRPPTHEVIVHVAERLGLDPVILEKWHALEGQAFDIEVAIAQIEVLSAFVENDFDDVRTWAGRLRALTDDEQRLGLWWVSSYVRILCDFSAGAYSSAKETAQSLRQHISSSLSPQLSGRVDSLLAQILRANGDLEEAVAAAESAVGALSGLDSTESAYISSRVVLASCLGELGRTDEALGHLDSLGLVSPDKVSQLDWGKTHWARGNLYFLNGDHAAGCREHDLAIPLIDPVRHLRLWGRLHRSSATMRIKSGGPIDDVPGLLAKADMVEQISPTTTGMAELTIARGMYWAAREEWNAAFTALHAGLIDAEALAPQTRADAYETLGEVTARCGRVAEAADHFARATALFTQVGAHARAAQIREERQLSW
ncbi:helix-turn-helix domain-containing protein [Austwickia chelonae]|uniref:helix-turn-helix domain-containing protein n=1 Tax=Austwickia chelonae TaxID=100225 RepID=UPI0013C30228|nr:helix-turn-helix transcriptional regulator [Austwickia chelonae]